MIENKIFSYTKRDYERSRQEGIAKIPILSKGHWTDLNATDPGIIILDYVHALVDMISYYLDHQALESFITTAKERTNIFRLAKQLSYEVLSAKGAICEVEFTSSLLYDYTIKIPRHTSLSTETGIKYLTTEDAYIAAGEHRVLVPCSQGILTSTNYQGTGISRFSPIAGASNQSIRLVDTNIDVESITLVDNIDRVWQRVDYIVFSGENDRVYQVDLNPDNSVTIKFGDGERGAIPKETDSFTISYITTAAEGGRVGENAINILDDMIYSDNGEYVDLSVNNPSASSGGTSAQSSSDIRELAPGAIKSQDRAVTTDDFANLAKLVDGVEDAEAYDINSKPDLCLYHEVKVLVIPKDKNGSIEVLKNKVHDFLSRRMIPPTNLQVLTPSYKTIDIDIVVKKLGEVSDGRVSYAVQQAITNYFDELEDSIGEAFYPSDLLTTISSISDVRTILDISPSTPVQAEELSVIRLGKVNITVQ